LIIPSHHPVSIKFPQSSPFSSLVFLSSSRLLTLLATRGMSLSHFLPIEMYPVFLLFSSRLAPSVGGKDLHPPPPLSTAEGRRFFPPLSLEGGFPSANHVSTWFSPIFKIPVFCRFIAFRPSLDSRSTETSTSELHLLASFRKPFWSPDTPPFAQVISFFSSVAPYQPSQCTCQYCRTSSTLADSDEATRLSPHVFL